MGFIVGLHPGQNMPVTTAKVGAFQGSTIVVVGESGEPSQALIIGPGKRLLTPSILVRIQVPQPGILLKSLRICSFLARRNSLETSAR